MYFALFNLIFLAVLSCVLSIVVFFVIRLVVYFIILKQEIDGTIIEYIRESRNYKKERKGYKKERIGKLKSFHKNYSVSYVESCGGFLYGGIEYKKFVYIHNKKDKIGNGRFVKYKTMFEGYKYGVSLYKVKMRFFDISFTIPIFYCYNKNKFENFYEKLFEYREIISGLIFDKLGDEISCQ